MLSTYAPVFPELFVVFSALALLLWGVFHRDGQGFPIGVAAIGVLLGAGLLIARQPQGSQQLFDGAFVDDGFARFIKVLTLSGSAFALLLSFDYMRREGILKFEYPVLVLLATAGMMLSISANDLIALYLALELQSLALYVVAAFNRDRLRSTEAGLKYFVLGVLSSGLLLYGASLVYGYTGATVYPRIAEAVASGSASIGLVFGLVFILAGLAFKIAAAPFHMWTPDVYEGAPTPVTAFFSAAPKIAAMAMLMRIIFGAFPGASGEWQQVIIALSAGSMAIGSFAAIGQRNIKRLLAYSSIGHVGYALIGLAAATPASPGGGSEGAASVLIYLAIYLGMTLGAFACVLGMRRGGSAIEDIGALSGVSRDKPLFAFVFAMLLFSLAGIPPLAGFFSKLYVFNAAVQSQLPWLAVTGVVLSVIGAYYYLRIVKIMYFDEPAAVFEPMPASVTWTIGLCSGLVVLFFLTPGTLKNAADAAARALF